MPLSRGVVYRLREAGDDVAGGLLLTNDRWNNSGVSNVGVLPVYSEPRRTSPRAIQFQDAGQDYWVDAGRLLDLKKAKLQEDVLAVDDHLMMRIEDDLLDLISAHDVLANPPTIPPAGPLPPNTPRWGEIYWVDWPIEGQNKRWVVVSQDPWNRRRAGHLVVRTTTSPDRGGIGYTTIQDGEAKAVVARATTILASRFIFDGRPDPPRCSLQEMKDIVTGVVDIFDLGNSAARLGILPGSSLWPIPE